MIDNNEAYLKDSRKNGENLLQRIILNPNKHIVATVVDRKVEAGPSTRKLKTQAENTKGVAIHEKDFRVIDKKLLTRL